MRRAHFKVHGLRFDRATEGTVTVEEEGALSLVRVRAHRRQREAVMLLVDVAQIVLERDAKALAAEKRSSRRRSR